MLGLSKELKARIWFWKLIFDIMKIFSRKKKVEILITLDFKKEIKNKYLNYLGFRNYYKR